VRAGRPLAEQKRSVRVEHPRARDRHKILLLASLLLAGLRSVAAAATAS